MFSAVLKKDEVDIYTLDATLGRLTPSHDRIELPQGWGPRHISFSPTDPTILLLADEGNGTACRLTVCHVSHQGGVRVTATVQLHATSKGLYPSEVLFEPNGRFAYVSIRDITGAGRDSVAVLRVSSSHEVTLLGHQPTGYYPRSMALSPDGSILIVANQKGHSLWSFERNVTTGLLRNTGLGVHLDDAPAFVMLLSSRRTGRCRVRG